MVKGILMLEGQVKCTKMSDDGDTLWVHTPLIDMTKAEIIQAGTELGVDYELTVSCYQASKSGLACGMCDSCRIRKAGFEDAGIEDPTRYRKQQSAKTA